MKIHYEKVKRRLALCLIISFIGVVPSFARKSASIVICAETGKVHHQHNADTIAHPASLTKMMTIYMAFKAIKNKQLYPNQKLKVSRHAARQAPTKLGLKAGTTISVKDAIMGCVVKSANDAAVVLAEALGNGSETKFAALMTKEARKLGLKKTVFHNASGLPNKRTPNLSTAREMALLSQKLYHHFPNECKIFSQKTFSYKGTTYTNHNKLLGIVPGVNGIKTGYTNAAGYNLAASMKRNNKHYIAVVFGGESGRSRDKKMTNLLEATYKKHRGRQPHNQYDSLEDLLIEIASAADSTDNKPSARPAVYRPGSQKNNVAKASVRYSTLDQLLSDIDKNSSSPGQVAAPSSKTKRVSAAKYQGSSGKKAKK